MSLDKCNGEKLRKTKGDRKYQKWEYYFMKSGQRVQKECHVRI